MDENNRRRVPKSSKEVMLDTMVESARRSTELDESVGLPSDKVVVSCNTSGVQALSQVYQRIADDLPYDLHLGLTEAERGANGTDERSVAFAVLRQHDSVD